MCKNHFDITAGINLIRSLRCEIVLLLTDDTALKQNQSINHNPKLIGQSLVTFTTTLSLAVGWPTKNENVH